MKSDPELDALVAALRTDLPNARESARLRARLSTLGLASSVGAAATASTSVAQGAALGTAGGVSWALKAGAIAVVSVSAVAGPAWLVRERWASPVAVSSAGGAAAQRSAPSASRRTPKNAGTAVQRPTREESVRAEVGTSERATARDEVSQRSGGALGVAPAKADEAPAKSAARPTELPVGGDARVQAAPASTAAFADSGDSVDSALSARAKEPTTLREETALIDRALSALRSGDVTRSGAVLAEHRRRFPNGLLTQERERAQRKVAELLQAQSAR